MNKSIVYLFFLLSCSLAAATNIDSYPSFHYPNQGYESVFSYFPQNKVLIFGYGSLMNKSSLSGRNNAARMPTVKPESVATMKPVLAFHVQRVFNYENQKGSYTEFPSEKAYLNLVPLADSVINGVTIEVDQEDLKHLIEREDGYDLVPILVADWEGNRERRVAYTFMASNEPREGIVYTNDQIYPIRNYVRGVESAAAEYGPAFLKMWRETTYLGDRTTKICDWDHTFK